MERRGPGRPADLDKRQAVVDATLDMLAEAGYHGLTIDGVAQRAGTARSFVYRVFESKTRLVRDALFAPLDDLEVPDTGTTRGDLRAWIELHVAVMHRPAHVRGLPGLTIDLMDDPDSFRETYKRYVKPTEDGFAVILERARSRGEAVSDVRPETLSNVMSGATSLLAQFPTTASEQIVDTVMAAFVGGVVATELP